jgi:rhomboid protease GluP
MQRQIVRTRFTLSQYPSLFTYILIALNVIVYILTRVNEDLLVLLIQYNPVILQGQYWRLFTSMFLHDPTNVLHIALNMLSLFFVGRFVEILFGKWRYLLIYFLAGLGGNILYLVLAPSGPPSLGASGAIFGVFGALGIFYLLNRRAMGPGMLSNWLLWLTLNLVLGFAGGANINMLAHIGGLVVGMVVAFLLVPRQRRRRYI